MNHAATVAVADGRSDLRENRVGFYLVETALLEHIGEELAARRELENEDELALVDESLLEPNDIGMLHFLESFGLPIDFVDHVGLVHVLVDVDELDGLFFVGFLVQRTHDGAEAALAELILDFVLVEDHVKRELLTSG